MEFRFNVNPLFKTNIIKVNNNLLPQGFTGDRRSLLDITSKLTEIINDMGEASARAQGLSKAITTAQKLRNSDQTVYLLSEKLGKNGSVTGLLKIGTKNLYVFDPNGDTKQVMAPCVLDFYVHESRQRAGVGKQLFEHMLEIEQIHPIKMAIDRPSEKLVGFLRKHYGLEHTIPQMNNFVVFDGFFDVPHNHSAKHQCSDDHRQQQMHITASPNTALFGPHFISDEFKRRVARSQQNSPSIPIVQNAPIGRFGARRPTCSMAEIIHSAPTVIADEPNSSNFEHLMHHHHHHHHDHVENDDYDEHVENNQSIDEVEYENKIAQMIENVKNIDISVEPTMTIINSANNYQQHNPHSPNYNKLKEVTFNESEQNDVVEPPASVLTIKKPTHFPLSKQHTGLKNISFNVGAAVSPTDKMEFDQVAPESFGVVKINRPIGNTTPLQSHHFDNTDAMSTVSSAGSEGLTDQGYFDLKFYHNKLW